MQSSVATYYPYVVRWQGLEGFLLWIDRPEPSREMLWAEKTQQVPIFPTAELAAVAVERLGGRLKLQFNQPVDHDSTLLWVKNEAVRPLGECLAVWHLFDDLSAAVEEVFIGNQQNKSRNRVWDLLYGESGPYLDSDIDLPYRMDEVSWKDKELATLRRILMQGFSLWQRRTYWAM